MRRKPIINCPHCGREYMVGEIFIPTEFVGQPTEIIKGLDGTVLSYSGSDMDLNEEYICDGCNKKFTIKASVNFKTEEAKDLFDDEFVSLKD